jgi:hypothetical protein
MQNLKNKNLMFLLVVTTFFFFLSRGTPIIVCNEGGTICHNYKNANPKEQSHYRESVVRKLSGNEHLLSTLGSPYAEVNITRVLNMSSYRIEAYALADIMGKFSTQNDYAYTRIFHTYTLNETEKCAIVYHSWVRFNDEGLVDLLSVEESLLECVHYPYRLAETVMIWFCFFIAVVLVFFFIAYLSTHVP